ncbi:translation initiation factor IF-2 [Candidatus Curculioniphilus buchneri]|uniref:translation initiation factor IF-2 n=1 Tax=Candidatus Curculioniphilus buchneri TaxID=690594 RepID=UPI00376ECD81
MTDTTVKLLSEAMKISADFLVQQFYDIGVNKTVLDSVSQQEKEILIAYLNRNRNKGPNQLTLQRKTHSTLKISSTGGKSKSVKIEVRKKHTYLQPDLQEDKQLKIEKSVQQHIEKKFVETKSNKLTNRPLNTTIKTLQMSIKARREIEAAELIRKAEEETYRKIEERARQIADDARRMAEEHSIWKSDSLDIDEEDSTTDYHITTFQHAREAEDENDRKVEYDRRIRVGKLSKNKKANRLSELKSDREEARAMMGRNNKSKRNKLSTLMQSFTKPIKIINRNVIIGETITVAELANKMAVKGSQVIKVMMKLGAIATINQVIDQETAQLVAEEMGHKVSLRHENELEVSIISDRNTLKFTEPEPRAPVVTIMGHVDHGKTSLLDYIRSTKIAAGEAGGITQHIGAYHVKTDNGMITFLDTPGHAAFTAMRARGVQVTDIVVLVVAADDGVMPQTIEAIRHAKAAKVPIVVAINKIDKPDSEPKRIKKELIQYGIISEEWGGDNQFAHVSAKSGEGIEELLNAILLQAEILELKSIKQGMAIGVVIESFLDKGRGPVATILIREGTLHRGDVVLCGLEYGRIRAMRNELGQDVGCASSSIPVEIFGLSGVPVSGDEVTVVRDEKKAREVALYRQGKFREIKLARQKQSQLKDIFAEVNAGKQSELNIVLKSDMQGSSEAIKNALENLSTDEIKINIINSGVGSITETDATLAAASNAMLLGFNVRADSSARHIIAKENVNLRYYSVIYDLISSIKQALTGMLKPEYKQEIIGVAEVRSVFRSPKFGAIAGCMVTEGLIKRYNKIRVLRENVVIYEGELESLRRFKDNINEVRNGMECGIGVKNYDDVRSGDIIEVFGTIETQRNIF